MAFYPCANNQIDRLIDGSITKIRSLVTTLRPNAFANCVNLSEVDLPNISDIPSSAFSTTTSLRELVFEQNITNIFPNAFNSGSLDTLVLKGDTLANLISINAFSGTPFSSSGTGGKLYVPQALISSYQTTGNWVTVLSYPNNQILAIEGSPYEV